MTDQEIDKAFQAYMDTKLDKVLQGLMSGNVSFIRAGFIAGVRAALKWTKSQSDSKVDSVTSCSETDS